MLYTKIGSGTKVSPSSREDQDGDPVARRLFSSLLPFACSMATQLTAHTNPMHQPTRKAAPFVLFFIANITAGEGSDFWASRSQYRAALNSSEVQVQSELDDTVAIEGRAADRAESSGAIAIRGREVTQCRITCGFRELGMVRQVEKVRREC